ncbi:histone-lysine N-methyltransferase SUVR5 isoform X1 [Cryptomeria japonica]|uniref:histone-lysine N-methyltransferase SUVR5 isoform X1 n=1 Tax=Cryptomeria japonica TaxID=3369 RepID=UPI0025ABF4C6|nr:histone-lysine N-methyltransferase SUVR5 isoform X1 [Cryptomeria japonica]XP_057872609.1 histone-lysine N-methyltransferase SUVR5 isoform X1 [Cryptomeria japonica]
MEVAYSLESQNDRDSDSCQQETRNESLSWINETGAVQVKAEETKQNDVRAIWVKKCLLLDCSHRKWRGKWQPGIQCSTDDCPSATLKGKPTSERKNYTVVYFPHSRSHCWADSQLICPITEKPEPLAYGTHESGFALVEDLQTPRRFMMQSLAVAMFDISDQLHIEAVVESARDVNVWREFAREAGRCKNYSDIGRMLVKLHSMILEVFISPTWTKNSFDLWKQQCENAQNTESTEILTKELTDSVLWDDVAKLWDAPVQPNLGSDWKTLKGECMKCFSTSYPSSTSRDEGEDDKRAYSQETSITKLEVCRKRPKLEIRRGEMRLSDIKDVHESQLPAHNEVFDSMIANQQEESTNQELSFPKLEGLTNDCQEAVATTWFEVKDNSEYPFTPHPSGYQETPIAESKSSSKNQLTASGEHRYRQCSAFIETKGRQCSRWASDGSIYCCKHLNSSTPDNANKLDQVVSLFKSPICQGMTTYGKRCTHRCKNGSSFCLKHLPQELPESNKTPSTSALVTNNKRARLSVEGQFSDDNAPSAGLGCEETKQDKSNLNLISDADFKDEDLSEKSTQRWSNDSGTVGRNQRIEFQSQSTLAQERSTAKVPYQSASWSRCIGWCRNNSGQCSHKAKPGTSYCEKHLPSSLAHEGKVGDRHVSTEILNQLLKSTSSEKNRNYLLRASDMLHEVMNVCLSEGTTYRSNSKGRIVDWILGEASKDLKSAEALLKIVSGEKEKLGRHLGIEEAGEGSAAIVTWTADAKDQFSVSSAEDDGMHNSSREIGILDSRTFGNYASNDDQMLRCKLCGGEYSDTQSLGYHWITFHKKEAQCFFRGYACRICNSPFTNKRGLERHVKVHHAESLLEQCVLTSCIHCGSHFMNYEQLWQHVVSAHSDEFIRSVGILEQVKGSNSLVPTETEGGIDIQNELPVSMNSKQEASPMFGIFQHASTSIGSVVKDKGPVNRNTPRRYTCRFCGLKFHLLPDLGRHHQAEHMGTTSNQSPQPKRRKEILSTKWRANKVASKLTQKVSSSLGLKHASIIARKKLSEKFNVHNSIMMNGCSEKHGKSEKEDKPPDFCSSAVAEMLLAEVQKARPWPSNQEILGMARLACCRFNLHATLEEKYGTLPERLYIKAARLCSEANIRVEWHMEGFVCPKECKAKDNVKPLVILTPLPDVQFHSLPAQLDDRETVSEEIGNGNIWEKAESHVVLTSTHFGGTHYRKMLVICEDLSFGKEATSIPCVIDEDLVDPSTYALFKEGNDLIIKKYMQNFCYITERLLDPSLGLDTKSSQLGCTCTQPQCSPESCDHVYLFDNDNDDAEDIYGQRMHGRFPYDSKGRIILEEGYLVYECNSMCSCYKECPNRVLQKGVQVKIEVYKTKQKGWAVRAVQTILRGTFICEYLGEVLNDQEANKRGERYDNEGCSYLYDIDAHIDASDLGDGVQPYVIDATKYGNVARFINHSCSPNLVNYQVLVESMDCQLAHIGLYASRDIAIGEELAYDYRYKLLPGKGCPCHCGASNCRGRLY